MSSFGVPGRGGGTFTIRLMVFILLKYKTHEWTSSKRYFHSRVLYISWIFFKSTRKNVFLNPPLFWTTAALISQYRNLCLVNSFKLEFNISALSQAHIQQLDRLLLWTQWFRWGGIASVSTATMAVWLVHQSLPAADRTALWLAFGPLPDSARNEFLINTTDCLIKPKLVRKSVTNNAVENDAYSVLICLVIYI